MREDSIAEGKVRRNWTKRRERGGDDDRRKKEQSRDTCYKKKKVSLNWTGTRGKQTILFLMAGLILIPMQWLTLKNF